MDQDQSIASQLLELPLVERQRLVALLERSISDELILAAAERLTANLSLVVDRLNEADRGATHGVSILEFQQAAGNHGI